MSCESLCSEFHVLLIKLCVTLKHNIIIIKFERKLRDFASISGSFISDVINQVVILHYDGPSSRSILFLIQSLVKFEKMIPYVLVPVDRPRPIVLYYYIFLS